MQEIGDMKVDTDTLDSIGIGLRDDIHALGVALKEMHNAMEGMGAYWQGKPHDDIIERFTLSETFVNWNYESLKECVEHLSDTIADYKALEQELAALGSEMDA